MKAVWDGVVIAQSDDTIRVDGAEYFRPEDVRMEYLAPSQTTSFCGWKGTASYYSVSVNGKTNRDCAWCYEEPNGAAAKIKGRIAFWNGVQVAP